MTPVRATLFVVLTISTILAWGSAEQVQIQVNGETQSSDNYPQKTGSSDTSGGRDNSNVNNDDHEGVFSDAQTSDTTYADEEPQSGDATRSWLPTMGSYLPSSNISGWFSASSYFTAFPSISASSNNTSAWFSASSYFAPFPNTNMTNSSNASWSSYLSASTFFTAFPSISASSNNTSAWFSASSYFAPFPSTNMTNSSNASWSSYLPSLSTGGWVANSTKAAGLSALRMTIDSASIGTWFLFSAASSVTTEATTKAARTMTGLGSLSAGVIDSLLGRLCAMLMSSNSNVDIDGDGIVDNNASSDCKLAVAQLRNVFGKVLVITWALSVVACFVLGGSSATYCYCAVSLLVRWCGVMTVFKVIFILVELGSAHPLAAVGSALLLHLVATEAWSRFAHFITSFPGKIWQYLIGQEKRGQPPPSPQPSQDQQQDTSSEGILLAVQRLQQEIESLCGDVKQMREEFHEVTGAVNKKKTSSL